MTAILTSNIQHTIYWSPISMAFQSHFRRILLQWSGFQMVSFRMIGSCRTKYTHEWLDGLFPSSNIIKTIFLKIAWEIIYSIIHRFCVFINRNWCECAFFRSIDVIVTIRVTSHTAFTLQFQSSIQKIWYCNGVLIAFILLITEQIITLNDENVVDVYSS